MMINFHEIQQYFIQQPILKAWIFGSVARGDDSKDSDVDILVQFDPNVKVGLFKYARIIDDLEKMLNKKIDLVEDGTFHSWVEKSVEKDKILIYERTNTCLLNNNSGV